MLIWKNWVVQLLRNSNIFITIMSVHEYLRSQSHSEPLWQHVVCVKVRSLHHSELENLPQNTLHIHFRKLSTKLSEKELSAIMKKVTSAHYTCILHLQRECCKHCLYFFWLQYHNETRGLTKPTLWGHLQGSLLAYITF